MTGFRTALAMAGLVVLSGAAAAQTTVAVEGGQVRSVTQGGVEVWYGIPYAAPPVGDLRWRAPQPPLPWDGVLRAETYGPACTQPDVEFVSEDCLTLNVFRPAAAAAGPLPVMVWIHGGAMVRGSAAIYPLQALAAQGVVGVSLNYRLGRLGFFAHPALATEGEVRGNYGYLDQLAALEWVRDTIAAFGGDPGNVTIFGESAGGGSVLAHLVSPLSRGLFHAAILQSPGTPGARASEIPAAPLAQAEAIALDYAATLGIDGRDARAAEALRALPAATLVDGASGEQVLAALARRTVVSGMAMAILDGTFLPETPEAALRAGRQAPVPVMVGGNSRDLGLGVADSTDALFARLGDRAAAARAAYDPTGAGSLDELEVQVFMDMTMLEPARHLADLVAGAGQPAWLYRFSYVPEAQRASMPGTLHGMEIPYTLGVPTVIVGAAATTEADRAMAAAASGYWVNFAKTGDPNGAGLPDWPHHDPASARLLNFMNEGVQVMDDPRRATLDLWATVQDGR
jgi:para-nitrobenzyl esterase